MTAYTQPPFQDYFSSDLGILGKSWDVLLGEAAIVDGVLRSPTCGIVVTPFNADSVYILFQAAEFSPGAGLFSVSAKVTSDGNFGFSLSLQDDFSLSIEATINGQSRRIAVSPPNIFEVGNFLIFAVIANEDGSHTLEAYEGYTAVISVAMPDWAQPVLAADGDLCGAWLGGEAALDNFVCGDARSLLPLLPLVPLRRSFDANQIELDIKNALVSAYNDLLAAQHDEIAAYGAPHLGSFALVERHVSKDGLALLRQGDETGMRYLFKAWKHRNPKRGTAFLKTYLQVLFGGNFEVSQLWQEKALPYPTALRSQKEIELQLLDIADHFLTSRIRVDLDIETIPENIIRSLRTALAARFVLMLRVAKYYENNFYLTQIAGGSCVFAGYGKSLAPSVWSDNDFSLAQIGGASVVFSGYGQLVAFPGAG